MPSSWDVDVAGFESALDAFGALSPEFEGIDAGIASIRKLIVKEEKVEAPKEKAKQVKEKMKKEAEGERRKTSKTSQPSQLPQPTQSPKPRTKREQAMAAIVKGDYAAAEKVIGELLVEKPNGAVALNLKAAMEARQGKLKAAEATLDQAILSNPRNHFAYYNMANLMLQVRTNDTSAARRYYETGRALGGPVDAKLEEALK